VDRDQPGSDIEARRIQGRESRSRGFAHAVTVLRIAKGGIVASANVEQAWAVVRRRRRRRVRWTSPFFPDLDTGEPLDVYFAAHDLQAAVLYPLFLPQIFTYFAASRRYAPPPSRGGIGRARQSVDGTFELKDGVFQIPEVGQEFRAATAKIAMSRGGEVEITNVSARGSNGRLTASGR